MLRFIAQTILSILANAAGLLIASVLFEDFTINGSAFILAVLIFSFSSALLGPFIVKQALQNAPYLMGGIALVTTFVSLLLTSLLSDGLSISGLSTWMLSTFVVWFSSVIASLLLPLVLFKKTLQKAKQKSTE